MTANVSNSCFHYLDRLVDEYNNTYYRFFSQKTVHPGCSTLPGEIEPNNNLLNFELVIELGLLGKRIFLAKAAQKICQKKYIY